MIASIEAYPVTAIYNAEEVTLPTGAVTVATVRQTVKALMNIPTHAHPRLNGAVVQETTVVGPQQILEFIVPWGIKGTWDARCNESECKAAWNKLHAFVMEAELRLEAIGKQELEARAEAAATHDRKMLSLNRKCVNYLRHACSRYDEIVRMLNQPNRWLTAKIERQVLYRERYRFVAIAKKRILDAIAEDYPWLKDECEIVKMRKGVEDDPGRYVLPMNPYKGRTLAELSIDELRQMLKWRSVQKALRRRIERHLDDRLAE